MKSTSADLTDKQGIAFDGTNYYTTDNNNLTKWTSNFVQVTQNTDPIGAAGLSGAGIDHCGDLEVVNGLLYIPMEIAASPPYNDQWIAVFNASDLTFVTKYDVSAQATELSGLAYNPADNLLYAISFATPKSFLKYTLTGTYVGEFLLKGAINSIQGATFFNGYIYATTSQSATLNLVNKIDLNGNVLGSVYRWEVGAAGQEIEGICNDGANLVFLAYASSVISKAYTLNN